MIDQVERRPLNKRQAAKVRTRAKVLKAARTLFERSGYEQTTIRDIAKEAEMSTGAVFANFDDKLDLFVAVLKQDYGALVGAIHISRDPPGPIQQKITAICAVDYRFCHMRHHLLGVLVHQDAKDQGSHARACAALKQIRIQFTDLIRHMIDIGISEQQLSDDARRPMLVEVVVNNHFGAIQHAALSGMNMVQYHAYLLPQLSILLSPFVQEELKAA